MGLKWDSSVFLVVFSNMLCFSFNMFLNILIKICCPLDFVFLFVLFCFFRFLVFFYLVYFVVCVVKGLSCSVSHGMFPTKKMCGHNLISRKKKLSNILRTITDPKTIINDNDFYKSIKQQIYHQEKT